MANVCANSPCNFAPLGGQRTDEVVNLNQELEQRKGRTVLVIAHRLSTVRALDRIVTLEHGRLVEDGTHDALIRTGGRYASLHRLQGGILEVS